LPVCILKAGGLDRQSTRRCVNYIDVITPFKVIGGELCVETNLAYQSQHITQCLSRGVLSLQEGLRTNSFVFFKPDSWGALYSPGQ
jgi:hypothetical protein